MKIMIVDDKKENLYLLETLLRAKGFQTSTAINGKEALEQLKADTFGLIISDILMPVMDGFRFCRECKQDDALKHIPFVFYTATYTEKKDEEFALSLGADRFILKPVDPLEFIGIIMAVLDDKNKGRLEPAEPACVGEAEVYKQYNERLVRKLEDKMLALERSEERFQTLLASLKDVIWSASADGREFHYINPAVEHIFGRPAREFIDDPQLWNEVVHPDDREIARQGVQTLLETGEKNLEYRIIQPNGAIRWLHDRAGMVYDETGRPVRIGGVATDITERKQSEAEKEKIQQQLHQAQKMEAVGTLAGGVAHDFNNMLGVILGNTELAMMKLDSASSLRTDLQEIHTAAHRSVDLTRQLLAFARKQTVCPVKLDMNETVANMLKMLQRLIGEDIDLAWLPGHNVWPVKMDPTQLDQILTNLMVNARDAIDGVGKVTIETNNLTIDDAYCEGHVESVPGEHVALTVSDTGCGMDKEVLQHIYEPFFSTKEPGRGTGLGLATVYGIIKQNQGFMNVYSEPGVGTTFKVCLPRLEFEDGETPAAPAPQPLRRGTETLLIVEDELAILNIGKRILKDMGYTALTAGTPEEAIQLVENHTGKIDLLLTDVVLPQMNGRELAERLAALRPGLRCLYMSGYSSEVIARHGVLEKGVHFIQKPFSIESLTQKVRAVLDGPPAQ